MEELAVVGFDYSFPMQSTVLERNRSLRRFYLEIESRQFASNFCQRWMSTFLGRSLELDECFFEYAGDEPSLLEDMMKCWKGSDFYKLPKLLAITLKTSEEVLSELDVSFWKELMEKSEMQCLVLCFTQSWLEFGQNEWEGSRRKAREKLKGNFDILLGDKERTAILAAKFRGKDGMKWGDYKNSWHFEPESRWRTTGWKSMVHDLLVSGKVGGFTPL